MEITCLNRKEIDARRWDETITGSGAETLYPYSWYLDLVAEHWSALVADNYRFVMPLVWKRKLGIAYLYQPFYTQQLGIFSREYVDPHMAAAMISRVPVRFRKAQISFNVQNLVSEAPAITVSDRYNYVLKLSAEYPVIQGAFSTNAQRNIRKGESSSAPLRKDLSVPELVRFKRTHDVITRSEKEYVWLEHLLEGIMAKGAGKIYATGEGGELTAAAFFAFSRTRAIYLVSVSSEEGKEQRSMFRIVDGFIREHAGSGLILDFEGSNIPSVARFFSGFGASREVYQAITLQRFPFSLFSS